MHDLIEGIPVQIRIRIPSSLLQHIYWYLPLATYFPFLDTMTLPTDGMGPVKIPANLPELVRTAFHRARASGDVHFFPTQVTLVNVNSVPVRIRP